MRIREWFQSSSPFFAVSYLQGGRLQLVFVERRKNRLVLVDEEIEAFQSKSPVWIHMVLRSAAFVKTFSLVATSHADFERALNDRIHSEIPYLPDEVILQREVQERKEGGPPLVLMMGISKAVLNTEMDQLKRVNVIPDYVVLSTDVLKRFYRRRFSPAARTNCGVMIHGSQNQVELLFFKGDALVQSLWISKDAHLNDSMKASLNAFQREWHEKPEKVFFTEEISVEIQTLVSSMGLKAEEISSSESSEIPFLPRQALESCFAGEVNDFIPPDAKELRDQKQTSRKHLQLIQSVVCLSASTLLLSFIQLAILFAQFSWFSVKNKSLEHSVRELKAVRKEVLEVQSFYEKKSKPMLLLASLRTSIPEALFLKEIKYDEIEGKVVVRGIAPDQGGIDQFVSSLSKGSLFKRLNLQSVQGEQNDQGASVYQFVIEGPIQS